MKPKNFTKTVLSLLLIGLLAFGCCGSVMAAGGNGSGGGSGDGSGGGSGSASETTTAPGSGDGTGGGSTEPLTIVTVTPADKSTEIAIDTPIKLEFSKNVAYATVRDANLKAVSLWAGDQPVAAEITMADDQLEPDLRNFINIVPSEQLKEGTVYTIKVDTTLSSKSGDVLTAPITLTFTTAGTNEAANQATSETANSGSGLNTTGIIIGLMAIAIVVGIVIVRRKKA
ncbi:Ig-like domain-containing protein [Acetobacterium wieringae]|uniref:Ig-like domain-containing protein n=1 Tax=Acetobacterium wieringae TaxID=52694 RepID=UPI00203411FC|nr:Ig-like domain-containing protein [Acetobacterium wieringae]URN83263.1 Ig-like domain-containing protein [Acetobacterium wieringae]